MSPIESFITTNGVDGFQHAVDLDGSIWERYGILSQPSFAFINDDGTVESYNGSLGVEGLTERLDALTSS